MKKYNKIRKEKIINLNIEIKNLEIEKEKMMNGNNVSYTIFFGILTVALSYLFSEILDSNLDGDPFIVFFAKIFFLIFVLGVIIYGFINSIKPSFKEVEEINKKIKLKNKKLLEIIYK